MGILHFVKDLFGGDKPNKGKSHPKVGKAKKKAGKKPKRKSAKRVAKPIKKNPKKIKSKKEATKKPESPALGKVVGVVTHHFAKIQVGVIKLKAELKVGDTIHIKGAHDDFKQVITSMQIDHKNVTKAKKGIEVGIKVRKPVHENDKVHKVSVK